MSDAIEVTTTAEIPSHRRATVVVKRNTKLHARPRALGGEASHLLRKV